MCCAPNIVRSKGARHAIPYFHLKEGLHKTTYLHTLYYMSSFLHYGLDHNKPKSKVTKRIIQGHSKQKILKEPNTIIINK